MSTPQTLQAGFQEIRDSIEDPLPFLRAPTTPIPPALAPEPVSYPYGFRHSGGPSTQGQVNWYNHDTGQVWTAPSGGFVPPPNWNWSTTPFSADSRFASLPRPGPTAPPPLKTLGPRQNQRPAAGSIQAQPFNTNTGLIGSNMGIPGANPLSGFNFNIGDSQFPVFNPYLNQFR